MPEIADGHIQEARTLTTEIRHQYVPERTKFPDEVGELIGAGTLPVDTDRIRRKKLQTAVERIRNRGLWADSLKIDIDAITGLDSQLYVFDFTSPEGGNNDFVFQGGGTGVDTLNAYWSIMGGDGAAGSDIEGIALLGDGFSITTKGNVPIDLGGDAVTPDAATLEQVINQIRLFHLFGYFRLHLGYVGGSGEFITYPNGVI